MMRRRCFVVLIIYKAMFELERDIVEQAWSDRAMLQNEDVKEAIRRVVEAVDKGVLRCAEPIDLENSKWQVNEWVKKAIIMYFPIQTMRTMQAGELPLILEHTDEIGNLVKLAIEESKNDWDSFETSWDFMEHPLIRP